MNPQFVNAMQSNQQMQAAFNPVFGNTSFMVTAPQNGQLMKHFPEIAYFSIEAIAAQQQVSANQVRSGNVVGNQNVNGAYTVQDSGGTNRVVLGYSKGGF